MTGGGISPNNPAVYTPDLFRIAKGSCYFYHWSAPYLMQLLFIFSQENVLQRWEGPVSVFTSYSLVNNDLVC